MGLAIGGVYDGGSRTPTDSPGVANAMRTLFAYLIITLAAFSAARAQRAQSSSLTMAVLDFDSPNPSDWRIQNDGVMGGKSTGRMEFADDALYFTGEVVTRGGGFTSVLTAGDFDFSAYEGVMVHVRGGGRTFEFAIDDGVRSRGRGVWRRAPFMPTDDWTWVRLPFANLRASVHGEPYDAPALDKQGVQQLGFYIIDGQDGAFRLEVREVRGY